MDEFVEICVTIEVKTCSVEKCHHPLLKKFINPKFKDGILVRDVAGSVTHGMRFLVSYVFLNNF